MRRILSIGKTRIKKTNDKLFRFFGHLILLNEMERRPTNSEKKGESSGINNHTSFLMSYDHKIMIM
jgi:hypothetical protein